MTGRSRSRWMIATSLLLLGSAVFEGARAQPATSQNAEIARGQAIAEQKCARCHATGRADASPNPKAPPFRTVGKLYPLDHLAEAFAEGIITGDNDMPQFKFEPPDIDALIAYLGAMSAAR